LSVVLDALLVSALGGDTARPWTVRGLRPYRLFQRGREASLEVHVTIIDRAGVRRASCDVPVVTSVSALRRWLTKALDLGGPVAWHVN
jgi:hypothetical protein